MRFRQPEEREERMIDMTGPLTINATKDGFVRDGAPFFYFADTVWSVFTNTPPHEWEEYLRYRAQQGFNVLQISVLPLLHDTSDTFTGLLPFAVDENGRWDFDRIDEAYFDRAEAMVRAAKAHGFTCALVLLWSNFVPDTTFSKGNLERLLPFEAVAPYTEYVAKRFAPYEPMYYVSGDTDFGSERTIDYYMTCLRTLKRVAPEALASMHLNGEETLSPERIANAPELDFYAYQSCHFEERQYQCWTFAEAFLAKPIKRPIVNSEPLYEGHGHGNKYGRFHAFDVRKAFWWSVLSGAKAGFAYGAHGLFSWHRSGAAFTSESWSKIPFDWRTALRMDGAWDAGFCKWLFERYELHTLEPAQRLQATPYEQIRTAATPSLDKIVVYIPYSNDVTLTADLSGYRTEMIDLAAKRAVRPSLAASPDRRATTVRMYEGNADVVFIATRA